MVAVYEVSGRAGGPCHAREVATVTSWQWLVAAGGGCLNCNIQLTPAPESGREGGGHQDPGSGRREADTSTQRVGGGRRTKARS